MKTSKFIFIIILLFILSLSLFAINLFTGSVSLFSDGTDAEFIKQIFFTIRLPRTFAAFFSGLGIGVAGLLLQSFFRNPLADPYILGVNSGASLGVALILLVSKISFFDKFYNSMSTTFAASVGAIITTLTIIFISTRTEKKSNILIIGIFISFAINAIVSVMLFFALPQQVDSYVSWNFGSFARLTLGDLPIFSIPILISFIFSILISKQLNIFLLGKEQAIALGVDIKKINIFIILLSAIPVAVVTSFCGPITFIGIAATRIIVDFLKIEDRRLLIPLVGLSGASMALLADIIAKGFFWGQQLPLNSVLSFLSLPIIIMFLLKERGFYE